MADNTQVLVGAMPLWATLVPFLSRIIISTRISMFFRPYKKSESKLLKIIKFNPSDTKLGSNYHSRKMHNVLRVKSFDIF